jgi:hypothetical protein
MQSTGRVFASGANYEIVVEGRRAIARVWNRPELSFERGARLAEEVLAHIIELAKRTPAEVTGVLMDVRDTKPLVGKRTRAVVTEIAAACAEGRVRLAFLASSPVTRTLIDAAIGGSAGGAAVFPDEDQALAWIAEPG